MPGIYIEGTHEREETVIAYGSGDIAAQQADHSAPIIQLNPAWVKESQDGRRVDPVAVMKMVIVQSNVAAECARISDERAPIAVVVKHLARLVVGCAIEPVLQLVLQADLQTAQRGDRKSTRLNSSHSQI